MMGKASFPFRLCLLLQRFPLHIRTCHAADLIACGRIFFQNFFPIFPFKACKQRNRRIASADAVGFFQLRIEAQHDMHIILPDHSADDRSKQTRRVYEANVDCGAAQLSYRTVAIARGGQTIIARQDEIFMEGDMVYVIARQDAVKEVMEFSGHSNVEINNMMILGGSRIGIRIATELQDEVNIKLIDYNAEKAYRLAELLDKTLIINEDGRHIEAMLEEGLANMDAFIAVTGRSETNILAAMLAKRMCVKKVIAEIENLDYINLAESIGIDTIINKKLVTASNIFRFTMSTDVQAIKCLTGSEAEVLEFIVKPNAPATKAPIKELKLPQDTIIGGVVRGDKVFIAVGNMELSAYDRVVVFAMPASISKIGYFFN